jgi:poly(A) polymerase
LRRPNIDEHLELYRANCLSQKKDLETYSYCLQKLAKYLEEPSAPPLISGEDLIALGYSPGPLFKEILRDVEDLQLECVIRTREEALAHVKAAFPLTEESGQIPRPH